MRIETEFQFSGGVKTIETHKTIKKKYKRVGERLRTHEHGSHARGWGSILSTAWFLITARSDP